MSAAGFCIYLSGCMVAQETLYRADPVSKETIWYSGEEYQTQTKDSLTVSVAFEYELGGSMTFYMVVGNQGSGTVLVAPEKIYYYGTDVLIDHFTKDTTIKVDTAYAINPESQLTGINRQMAQANAAYSTNNNINAASALLQLVGDVATIGKNKTGEEQKEEEQNRHDLKKSERDNQATYSSTIDQLSQEKDYWLNATLRKTTLFPNTAVAGKVCFTVDSNLQTFKLIVPIDSAVIEFDFKQMPVADR